MWRGCRMRPPATRVRSRSSLQPPRTPKTSVRRAPKKPACAAHPKQRSPRTQKTAFGSTLHTSNPNYHAKSAQTEKQHPRSGPHRTPPHLHPRIHAPRARPSFSRVEAYFAHLHRDLLCKVGHNAGYEGALGPTSHTCTATYCAKSAQTRMGGCGPQRGWRADADWEGGRGWRGEHGCGGAGRGGCARRAATEAVGNPAKIILARPGKSRKLESERLRFIESASRTGQRKETNYGQYARRSGSG